MANSIMFFSCVMSLPFVVDSLYFKFTSFRPGDPENVVYHGDAMPDGAVNFNDVEYIARVGWVTYAEKVPLWNPRTGTTTDFNTSFSFRIDTRNLTSYGHGICFFLAPVGTQLRVNSAGGFLGLFTRINDYTSPFPLVHIEFDSFSNQEWDPTTVGSHVGINNNSLVSSNYTSWNVSSHSQDIGHAKISYDSVTKNLSVSWAYELTSDPRESVGISYIIDLAKVLPPHVMVGFSAATGANTEGHRLLSWEFSSSLDIEKASIKKGLIAGVSVSGFVVLTSLVIVLVVWLQKQRKRKAKEVKDLVLLNEDLERDAGPRRFVFKDLVLATNRFSAQRKLGEGGFGAVYRGYLNELDMMVAVKKLSGGSKQGKKEFVTEVKIISKLRHRNLVQLIGWCNEKDEYLLIYEFMPNGSLDTHLFGKRPHLSWDIRYKIALGLASALLYLHEEGDRCVLHRDIKASNIMLDINFNVKLGDFGLARLMDHELGSHTTGLAGTFGYMAPEYVMDGRASKESDIYSFGIGILEILTGRKSVDHSQESTESEMSLVERVWDLYGRQELVSAIDKKLGEDFDKEQTECLLVVGLWCGHPDRNSRPSIKQAIQVLNLESPLPQLPRKMPSATFHISPSSSLLLSSSIVSATTSSRSQVARELKMRDEADLGGLCGSET
ncbi:PREDICTED: L-type lectin-domain containing receptor kinase IX.2-like [Camelina sativa]|uniref:L-type lectin-domain containing receptor kinase IX.2-like n=1 Tax=Camelina sativa TaxID=90675 RepID=A0ABM0WPT0_CAMSA|nr:PREDICTED: L-type lectin-domain containing receptor kinase IX.2-like [Camelina sativa]